MEPNTRPRRPRSMWTRIAVVVAVIVGVLSVGVPPAAACSCGLLPVEQMLAQSDGAFIGTLTDVARPDIDEGVEFSTGMQVAYTFEVSEWLKGQRDPGPFDVWSASDGVACGFELPVGREAAVFVSVNGDQATGGLCSTMDAATVRATVRPPQVSNGVGVYLATGRQLQTLILDRGGAVVGSAPTDPDTGSANLHTTCGGTVIAERRPQEVVFVDVATFEVTERIEFIGTTTQLLCDGDRVFAVRGERDARRVYDVRTNEELTRTLTPHEPVGLMDDQLIFPAQGDDEDSIEWSALDLSTGDERVFFEISTSAQRIESVALSPGGTHLVMTVAKGNQAVLDLVLVSTETGETVTREINTHTGSVTWLDNAQIFVSTEPGFDNPENALIVSGTDLTTLVSFDEELYWPRLLDGDHLIGVDRGSLRAISLEGGEVEVLNEFADTYRLMQLPEPIEASDDVAPSVAGLIEVPIASPVIEALPARVVPPPTTTAAPEADGETEDEPADDEVAAGDTSVDVAAANAAAEIDDAASPEPASTTTLVVALVAATAFAAMAALGLVVHRRR